MRNGNKYEKNQRKWTSIHYQRSMGRNDSFVGVEGKLHGHGCGLNINKVSDGISRGKPLSSWIQSVSVPHFLLSKSTQRACCYDFTYFHYFDSFLTQSILSFLSFSFTAVTKNFPHQADISCQIEAKQTYPSLDSFTN